ncbi:MAG: ABC transporter ATP-binding protein, partial [Rhodobacteraceae bacterium]|nr:ABC transporter ATP-binding protein [Paracoccaceae bacterium]
MTAPLLEVKNLCVRYDLPVPISHLLTGRKKQIEAVIDANFNLSEGQTLAIVGESGSGKSSLGRALIGLEKIAGGAVMFRGENPFAKTPRGTHAFHREVAMMFQDPISSLSPRRNVRQLISEPFRIHGLSDRDLRAEVDRLLGLVGLPQAIADRYPHKMSGGPARRVGVARAIALSPKLIVADEPTAGLDVSVQAEVLNLMRKLQDQFGMAYVLITHNISLIRHVADHIAVKYMGRIVEYGATEDVLLRAAHPYAAGLIAAQPHPDPERRRTEAPILGETPSLLKRPEGCEFRTRCPLAFA